MTSLFLDKNVSLTLHESSDCSDESVSDQITTSLGIATIGITDPLDDLDTHTYYVKQSYRDVNTCSAAGIEYAYSLEMESLSLSYDDLIVGGAQDPITVTKVLPGSSVSLHRGSCESEADDTITEDGSLTPSTVNTYTDTSLYVKYTYGGDSVCSEVSRYVYLEKGVLSLNSAQTDLHKRRPTFDVTNLFSGKEVTVALYENSTCSGVAVSGSEETDTGSATLTLSSDIEDNNTHTYYVKQSFAGESSCSVGVEYTYGLSISDLTVTSSPILYGSTPGSISVSGLLPGSTVSLHKGSCNAVADDSISEDGTLTPTPVNTYIEADLYLKYTLNQGSSCQSIGVSYVNLEAPTLALNVAQTNLDKRYPKFNVTNLFSGKNIAVTLHESSNCSGAAVSATVNTDTGSALVALSSALTDINSHTYSVKQSYLGQTSCSNTVAYQYTIDTGNLVVVADDLLYGTTPGSISVSHILSGSTVSLHKGSCGAAADASITSDGTLTPTSSGSYNHSQLYIKYTKGGSSDCDPIDSYYLYLEQPTLSLNSTQTGTHPLTPTFNVANLFSGKSVTTQLYETSTCTGEPVSVSSSTSSGSTTLTLSSAISDGFTHTYYVKQSYLGESTCSLGADYSIPVVTEDLTITTSITNGVLSASVSGGYVGSSVSLHIGACNETASDTASFTAVDQSLDLSVTANSYSYQNVYLKYTLDDSYDCVMLDKNLTYLAAPTLAMVSPLSDKRVPEFNITGLYSGQTVTVQVYESSDCTGSTVTTSSTTNTGSKTLTKSFALTDINSHTYSAKQTFNGISSCSNSISYTYPLNVDSLTVTSSSILYGTTPGSVSVSGMLTGSTVSLHKGSCGASADASRSSDGTLTPTSTGSYSEQTLYLKYSHSGSNNCQALSSKYLYLEAPVVAVDDEETSGHKDTPTFSVTNLFSGKEVTVTLHEESDCSDTSKSASVVSSTGSASVTLSSALLDSGTYEYYVKQSYSGYSTCSSVVEYEYVSRILEYVSSIPEYNRGYFYENRDQNRGIVISGTLFGNTVKVYEGDSCDNEGNLLASVFSMYDTTFVHLPNINDGTHRFSFKELDAEDNLIDCYSTGNVRYKTPEIYSNTTGFIHIHDTTVDYYGDINSSYTFSQAKAPKAAYSNGAAFAVLHADGSVTTYGDTSNGGNSSSVASQIDGTIPVIGIYSNYDRFGGSFAALRSDGSVVAWGDSQVGGSTTSPVNAASQLTSGVVKIFSNGFAYAALKSNGSVVTWGHSDWGGNSSSVSSSLTSGVVNIISDDASFAALKSDGSVVVWGDNSEVEFASVASDLDGTIPVIAIYSAADLQCRTGGAFAALRSDGSVVTWGDSGYGGNSSSVASQINGTIPVTKIYSHADADSGGNFAALRSDGSVVTWGDFSGLGGSISGVKKNFSNAGAFAGIKSDGSVVAWGAGIYGGSTSSPVNATSSLTSGVVNIFSTDMAFAALKEDGAIVTWGNSDFGGDSSSVASSLSSGVVSVASASYIDHIDFDNSGGAFSALKEDGSVVSWGDASYGGNQGIAAAVLNGGIPVTDIVGGSNSFMALRADGSVVIWGSRSYIPPIKIFKKSGAFAALKANGSVVAWGSSTYGGTIPSGVTSSLTSGVVNIYSNDYAFAALKNDGSVVTWGASNFGGNSSSVASKLTSGVVKIFPITKAFAALKSDGSVVTWGDSGYGGSTTSPVNAASQLTSGVVNIFSGLYAFAALKDDGSVVTWGNSDNGGDSSSVASSLTSGVVNILFGRNGGVAALKENGSVVTWGNSSYGGDSSSVTSSIDGTIPVIAIYPCNGGFAALRNDGSVVSWGVSVNSSSVASSLTSGVVSIFSSAYAFAALKNDGSVVTWGDSHFGGDSTSVASSLTSGVVKIFKNSYVFAALKSDGSVVTWGNGDYGGSTTSPVNAASQLTSGVVKILSNDSAFAALKSDGSVVTWGHSSYGGNSSSVASSLTSGVVNIFSNGYAFAALKSNGSVVTWGTGIYGGSTTSPVNAASQLTSGVVKIYSNGTAFAALKSNGSVVTWGNSYDGGDSSGVDFSL